MKNIILFLLASSFQVPLQAREISVACDPVLKADGYRFYQLVGGKNVWLKDSITPDTKLTIPDDLTIITVTAYNNGGEGIPSDQLIINIPPGKPKNLRVLSIQSSTTKDFITVKTLAKITTAEEKKLYYRIATTP